VSSVVELERASDSGRRPLARCTGDAGAFLATSWGRRPVLHKGEDPAGFGDLLSLDEVDRILSTTSLRTPSFRLVKAGEQIPESVYTRPGTTGSKPVSGMVDPARVFGLFERGATIVLQGLHRFHEPVTRFCRDLEVELGHPCQANAYITPPGAQGLALHDDPHDVFVLQAFGTKSWEVHEAPGELEREAIRIEIRPGDCVYMPTGTPHAASTQHSLSGHLTIGVHVVTWRDVVRDAMKALEADPSLDGSIPAGWSSDLEAFVQQLSERLAQAASALSNLDARAIVDARLEKFLSTRLPLLRGGLVEQILAEDITDETRFERREGSILVLRTRDDTLIALLGDRRLEMPGWLEPAMRRIADVPVFALGEISIALPDRHSRAVLARRLVREGLLRPVT
jgi:bifunctional lysine-specific demethylase and histidyl-hydroxylase NO66